MIDAGPGLIGVCPLPGRLSPFLDDLTSVLEWNPAMVVSMTETAEMAAKGADKLGRLLQPHGIGWSHLPIRDYGAPNRESTEQWPALSQCLHTILENDDRMLLHCYGGQGRSGMIALRLLVERGEAPETALARLRAVRPGAVETDAQYKWAAAPHRG